MKPDHSPQPIRRVTVKVSSRDKKDPEALLAAIRESLRPQGIQIAVRTQGDSNPEETPPPVRPDEDLEGKARVIAANALDRAAAELQVKTVEANLEIEEKVALIVATRGGTWTTIRYWLARSVRITVKLYETIAAKVEIIVGAVFPKGKT